MLLYSLNSPDDIRPEDLLRILHLVVPGRIFAAVVRLRQLKVHRRPRPEVGLPGQLHDLRLRRSFRIQLPRMVHWFGSGKTLGKVDGSETRSHGFYSPWMLVLSDK